MILAALDSTQPTIGVFDSGLGGLSVLRAIRARLPLHPLLYIADSAHAPYGDRDPAYVEQRVLQLSQFLIGKGASIIVIACNTATTQAVNALRLRHAALPVVGVEPGIKPAVACTRNQRIGVMATTGTLRSEKFQLLAQAYAAHVELVLQPCPGLVDAIEAGNLEAPAVTDLVTTYCARLREAQVDTVVLGCTHYPFVARHIQQAMGPDVMLVDTAHAVARQTANVAKAFSGGPTSCATLSAPTASGTSSIPIEMWTTGPADRLQKVSQEWLSWHYCVSSIAV
jgi:glutamate racemase